MILLDTHVWVWWMTDPDRLSSEHYFAIADAIAASNTVAVSVFSC